MASRMLWASSRIASHLRISVSQRMFSSVPETLKYAASHEWVMIEDEGKIGTVGITDYAQKPLGDIVHIEMPDVGRSVVQGEKCGVIIQSAITKMDVNSPVSGKVLQVNEDLSKAPELLSADPYGEGWIIKVELSDAGELDKLMDSDKYSKFCEEEDAKRGD